MEESNKTNDQEKSAKGHKNFREKYLNKKFLLILALALLIIGAGSGAALLKASEKPAFCGNCHIIRPYYESWKSGALLDSKHAEQNVTCQECHHHSLSGKIEEGLHYITGDYTLPLKSENGERAFCLECHSPEGGAPSWKEIVAATNFEESNPHDSHNGKQDCNLCHKMHEPSTVMCSQCHSFNWMKDLGEPWV